MNDPVILFDGICNFCNSSVRFLIKRDRRKILRFAPLQSEIAINLLKVHGWETKKDSILLIENGKIYDKSTAALKIAKLLGGCWKLVAVLYLIPKFIRNKAYDMFAKHRYQWFGKRTVCMVPTQEIKDRFL